MKSKSEAVAVLALKIDSAALFLYKTGRITANFGRGDKIMFFRHKQLLPLLYRAALIGFGCFALPSIAPAESGLTAQHTAGTNILPGSGEDGKILFRRRCGACHYADKDKNKIGPSLYGIFGRQAGQNPGYAYSVAMKAAGADNLFWTAENLQNYLKSPRRLVPGTRMPPVLPPLSVAETANIIRYLQENIHAQ